MTQNKKIIIFSVFILVIGLCFVLYSFPSISPASMTAKEKKAVILDQLSLTYPNRTFVREATAILEDTGYTVDYIPGENVTVECYQKLAEYNIIILRVHSALEPDGSPPLALFTSEPYDKNKYIFDQLTDQVCRVVYQVDSKNESFFSVSPKFIMNLKDDFKNTTVILMGCDGLTYTDMAEAFIKKGAKLFIGFDGPVTASYSDIATLSFLKHFVEEGLWVEKARIMSIADAGSDPIYDTTLWYYPLNADYKRIDD